MIAGQHDVFGAKHPHRFPLAIIEKMTNAATVATMRSKRSKTRNFLEYATYRFFETVFRLLPPTWVDSLGLLAGRIAYHLMSGRRAIVIRNLRIAWGDSLNQERIESLTLETFRHVGANLLGGVRCMLLSDAQIRQHVTIEGHNLLQEHLKTKGHSAILALAHMGNWEILARIASLIAPGVPSGAFFRPLNNSQMNQMTIRRRQQSGTQLFSNKEGFMQSCSLLRDGGMLGILSDQNAGATGCLTPFFGRVTSCSPLAAVLHRRTGAKIFFVSIKRTHAAHWHIQITSHDSVTPVSTHSIMKGIEQALSSSPCDGFWFHNRWKTPRHQPFKIKNSRQSIDESGVTKPWRYVIVCSRNHSIAAASKPAIEHLIYLNQSDEFLLIHPPSMHTIANATSHALPEPDQLETLLRQLDQEKPYPIDMILYFCDDSMLLSSHKNTTIPMAAGMTYHKKHSLNIKIAPPTSAVNDPQTWWYFIRSLGCDPSDFPS